MIVIEIRIWTWEFIQVFLTWWLPNTDISGLETSAYVDR